MEVSVLTPLKDQPSGGSREKEEVFLRSFDLKEGQRKERKEKKRGKEEGREEDEFISRFY